MPSCCVFVALIMQVETCKTKKECREVEERAARARALVSRLRESPELMEDPMLPGALEDVVSKTLQRADALVEDYRRRGATRRYCKACKLTKRLRREHQDISREMMRAMWVTNITVFLPPPPAEDHQRNPYLGLFLPIDDNASARTCAAAADVSSPDCPCCPCWRPPLHDQLSPHRREADIEGENVLAEIETAPSLLFPGLKKFSFSELEDATDGFSKENIIGRGGSGSIVFKGVLNNDIVVAIKKFQDPAEYLVARICNELHLASELHHTVESNNIIRILGYGHKVIRKHDRVETSIFLVREYMAKGKMDNIIYGSRHDWSFRFRIIKRIADGIDYLHKQDISHLDLKPTNILFDSDMNPKITGFGRSRKLDKPIAHDDSIVGTVGYMPPEYILEGTISTKYDVYSFGVILLETISDMCGPEPARHKASVDWAWEVRDKGRRLGDLLLDQSLCGKEGQLQEVGRCLKIGLLCAQEKAADRPTMLDVRLMLHRQRKTSKPKRPETPSLGTHAMTEHSAAVSRGCSYI